MTPLPAPAPVSCPPLLAIDGLTLQLGPAGPELLQDLDLELAAGERLGLVGESGCGKSLTALAVMHLLPPPIRQTRGEIRFAGQSLAGLAPAALSRLRGERLAMVFQEPASALDPVYPVGEQVAEGLRWHRGLSRSAAREETLRRLAEVGLCETRRVAASYPHELSGGMRQRVALALALALDPELLLADEPTTALDATLQAQVLTLLAALAERRESGILLISHDLEVVARLCRRAAIMYAGRIVEEGPVAALFAAPAHPYTAGLVACSPERSPGPARTPLPAIGGQVPGPARRPPGCAFHPRCARASTRCAEEVPALAGSGGRRCACHHPLEALS